MFTEDLSLFFNTDEFAVTVSVGDQEVNGIFSDEPVETNFVQTIATTFTYRSADVDTSVDDYVINGNDIYLIKNLIPDGTGLMKLILEKQNG